MSTRPATNYVRMQRPSPVATRGFTLIEVMVALIIIAIGTLGLAKMQALALASTGASRSRALVAVEATSLAEAMHANHLYWSTSTTAPALVTITTSGGTTAPTFVTTGTLNTLLSPTGGAATNLCATSATMNASLSCLCTTGVSAPCTGTYVNMAASDLYDWGQGLASLLPNATATVSCNTGDSPIDCTIAITWTENAVALNTQEASAVNGNANTGASTTAAFQYVTYSLYVVP